MACPLCGSLECVEIHRDRRRGYLRCAGCGLIHVSPEARLDAAAERSRYALHRNHPGDDGYRRFLSRLADPLLAVVPVGAVGLDFGCGPGPVLAEMLRAAGRPTAIYDPFFAPDEAVWTRTYDFITASEVFEHLFDPAAELNRLFAALKPGGVLAVMTSFVPASPEAFANWHYLLDETHVCFYDRRVFEYIADRWSAAARFPADNVVMLCRP